MIALPKGKLLAEGDGSIVAILNASRPARKEMRDWFDRLAVSRPRRVLVHDRVEDGRGGFEIHYETQPRDAVPLSTVIAGWRTDPQTSVTAILGLGRFVFEVAGEMAEKGFGDVLLSPATIRLIPGSPDPWRLVPLPTRLALPSDWARAEPEAWLWGSSESILAGEPVDPVHLLGASLHHAIVGNLMPDGVPDRDKFARLLRGRTGLPSKLGAAVREALPRSLEAEAATLERLILDCLHPVPSSRPRVASARDRFEELTVKLSVDRLIRYWQFENRPAIVARLSTQTRPQSSAGSGDVPTSTAAPVPSVSQGEQVPILVSRGDLAGALEAAWGDLQENGPTRARFYLAVIQRIAARSPGPSSEVGVAIDRLLSGYRDRLDESDLLRIAHLRVRHLGEDFDRQGLVHRKFSSQWTNAIVRLMQARQLLATGSSYNQVSRICKEALEIYRTMPDNGGPSGRYAAAYLHLLDGIAHIGAVSLYRNDSFYQDAFERFSRTIDLAGQAGSDQMIRAGLRWLGWLGRFTGVGSSPTLSLLSAGIEAILRAHGLTASSVASGGIPEIPWYDEAQLFPV